MAAKTASATDGRDSRDTMSRVPGLGRGEVGQAERRNEVFEKSIVCIWAAGWRGLWQRHQQLMSRLAPGYRILYVESPRDLWSIVRACLKGRIGLRQIFRREEVEKNLFVCTMIVPFSLRRYPRLNRVYLSLFLPRLKRLMRGLGMRRPLLWICYPPGVFFIGKLGETGVCYDCCDDLSDLPPRLAEIITAQESELAARADRVIVTTDELQEKLSVNGRRIDLIPNGADYGHFSRAANENLPMPVDLLPIPSPRIGFIGSIQEWVDVDLLAEVASQRPDWSWVLIGGVHTDVAALRRLSNVFFLGQKPYPDLPRYLRQLDVCTVPFKLKKITYAADPIKVYEYLSAGKPVVSTDLPRVRRFEVVRIAADRGAFIREIDLALKEDPASGRRDRMRVARSHAWEDRVRQIETVLEELASSRTHSDRNQRP